MHDDVKWGRLGVIVAVAVTIGGGMIAYEKILKKRFKDDESLAKKVLKLKGKAISSFRISSGNGSHFGFKCLDLETQLCKVGDNSKWDLTEPMKGSADAANVNALLSALSNLEPTESIDLTTETPEKKERLLKEYRLDQASVTSRTARQVEMTFADQTTTTLSLGETHPVGDAFFSLISNGGKAESDKVLLIASYFKSNFEKDLSHWRDKKVIAFATSEVEAFTARARGQAYEAKKEEGQWILTGGGAKVPGDLEAVDNLLTALGHLTARQIAAEKKTSPEAQKKLAGTASVFSAKVALKEPVEISLFLKGDKGPLFATTSKADPLFELDTALKDRLIKTLKDLRLAKLFSTSDRYQTRKVTLTGGEWGPQGVSFTEAQSKWSRVGGGAEPDSVKITNWLDRLSGNRVKDYLAGSAIPAGEAGGVKIDLFDEKNTLLRSYTVWKKAGSRQLVARDLKGRSKEALLLDPAVTDAFPFSKTAFDPAPPAPPVKKADK